MRHRPLKRKCPNDDDMGKPVPLIEHPVLTNYLLELDIGESVDPHHLPKED